MILVHLVSHPLLVLLLYQPPLSPVHLLMRPHLHLSLYFLPETEDIIEVIETLEMDTGSSETETASTEEDTTKPEITPLPDYKKLLSVVSELKYYYYENPFFVLILISNT